MPIALNKTTIGAIICLFTAFIFGFYPVLAKAVYNDGGNFAAVVIIVTFFRFLGLYGLAKWQKETLFEDRKSLKLISAAGLCQGLSGVGIFGAAYFLPGAVVIIIMFTYSLMNLFYAAYIKSLRLNAINLSITFITLFGLSLAINLYDTQADLPIMGIALAFLGAFATFVRTNIYAQLGQNRSPAVIGAEGFLIATLCLSPIMIWQFPVLPETSYGLWMLALCAFTSILGTYGMMYGLAYMGAYRFSMMMKIEPIFTALYGVLLLGNILNFGQYIGILIVVIALICLQIFDKQEGK